MKKRRKRVKPSTAAKIRKNRNKRGYTKKYLQIRNEVLLRDSYTCQLCGKNRCKLQAHHIKLWSKNVALRQNKRNLISLCLVCHKSIRNKEERYAGIFQRTVARNTARFRREKITYEELMEKMKEQKGLEGTEQYEYKTLEQIKKKKASEHYLRKTWRNMKNRTTNKNNSSYHRYGGRGITMCSEWLEDFEAFSKYIYDTLGERPEGYSIDRIENDGNYEAGNIRWASDEEQKQNNSQTKMDQAMVEAMFILYHKYKFKQVKIMHSMGLNTPTIVRNCIKFRCWRNITFKFAHLVNEKEVLEEINQYDSKSGKS